MRDIYEVPPQVVLVLLQRAENKNKTAGEGVGGKGRQRVFS